VLNKGYLKSKPEFFGGTSNRILPNPVLNSQTLSAITDLKKMDAAEGVQMKLENRDTVFVLIP
jgi:hypothetical protein